MIDSLEIHVLFEMQSVPSGHEKSSAPYAKQISKQKRKERGGEGSRLEEKRNRTVHKASMAIQPIITVPGNRLAEPFDGALDAAAGSPADGSMANLLHEYKAR